MNSRMSNAEKGNILEKFSTSKIGQSFLKHRIFKYFDDGTLH